MKSAIKSIINMRVSTVIIIMICILTLTTRIFTDDEDDVEFYVYPNPIVGNTNIYAHIEISGSEPNYEVDIKLYDLKFNLVRAYAEGRTIVPSPPEISLGEFGLDKDGNEIKEGIYLFYLKVEGEKINCEKIYKVSYTTED